MLLFFFCYYLKAIIHVNCRLVTDVSIIGPRANRSIVESHGYRALYWRFGDADKSVSAVHVLLGALFFAIIVSRENTARTLA